MSKHHMEKLINSTISKCVKSECEGGATVREVVEYLSDSNEIMLRWVVSTSISEEVDFIEMALWRTLGIIPLEPGKNAVYLEKDDCGILEVQYAWKATKEDYFEYEEGLRTIVSL